MKMRSSRTLVFYPGANKVTACNFLTRSVFECSPEVIGLLASWDEWASAGEIALAHGWSRSELDAVVPQLIDFSALVAAGSPLAEQEIQFSGQWNWGIPTALMHFCVQDSEFMTIEQAEARQIERAGHTAQPDLLLKNSADAIRLPNPLDDNELLALMAQRRTNRTVAAPTITARQLSDCLFAGMGITGETSNCVSALPLGMTPSGGARNPYEAYVVALGVEGLEPGVYHYSAADHDLGRISANHLPKISDLVGGQDWADAMPCLILLCARLDRTMWKYEDANAYRVVLIEAGHIGQNMMLAATKHGLSACPTAALSHSAIKRLLGLDRLIDAPIYALTVSTPENSPRPADQSVN
ncbi:SagB/ThcOx family dehydrogenase [Mesorhizobium sp. M00.F.Ca.ET.186.01.1.1]|nr:SagB/ThcOx family dehydrogenase [bacterium M00.F.Ca.ET.205.01.1.1]TGU54884.1 SagB/ThcOx family dehydrogenase [bacterium M00.F.Ca.ET.152.01.1.1]TGV38344.1 SagB/ThcOx family dehydrogenase [Mesorhizobium sp. M00.F.Ca.ET.186.01.1.1]TGZ44456.1 SagB/ThcOx family dehydrogenase [bacterium M00.F.Ca.ET.162.01.1.1]TIW62400.1 MAG: SagB/ThcOx family dehydrogenase [Mesorhizobium sp.]